MKLKKYLLILTGFVSLILGSLGIFIPLLPATPFYLLAAACFFRSSDKLYQWLINHKIFGKYILFYRKYRAISISTKITSIILLWTTITYSVFFVIESILIKFILISIAIGVTIHLLSLKTLTREMKNIYAEKSKTAQITDNLF